MVFGSHDEDIFPGSSLFDLDISMLRISLEHLQTSSSENFTMELYIASSLTSKSGSDSDIGTDFSDSSKVLEMFEVSEWVLASFGCSEVVEYIGVEDLSTKARRRAICKFPGNRALNISEVGRIFSLFEDREL